jgi:nucleotide-binding universal stress UspA family protein
MSDFTTGPIVVGVDGSADSTAAVELAATLAASTRQPLLIVWVRHLPAFIEASSALGEANAALDDLGDRLEADIKETLSARDVAWTFEARRGDPASQIMEAADEREASLVVVGHRGHNQAVSLLLGSVATRLVHHANQPVLVAR